MVSGGRTTKIKLTQLLTKKWDNKIFPYDDYAFWRECPTVNCRLTPSAPEVAKVLMSFFFDTRPKEPRYPRAYVDAGTVSQDH